MKYLITLVITIFLFDTAQSQVTREWLAQYRGPGSDRLFASDIAVDESGYVYVAGSMYTFSRNRLEMVTVKYDERGVQQWVNTYLEPDANVSGGGIALDVAGNIYVGSTITSVTNKLLIIKYNPAGAQLWVKTYRGPGNGNDEFVDIAVDEHSNVYILGRGNGTGGLNPNYDYVTIKYNSNGDELWVARFDNPSGGETIYGDEPAGFAVDKVGNVYVTGRSENEGAGTGFSFATVKYNSVGQQQWIQRYNVPEGNFSSEATSIALDESGNVYVTGLSIIIRQSFAYLKTIKYDPEGMEKWVKRFPEDEFFIDYMTETASVNTDKFGNIITTGTILSYDDIGIYNGIAIIKYSSSGEEKWTEIYKSQNNRNSIAKSTKIDVIGNIYTIGSILNGSYDKTVVMKYNAEGELKWEVFHSGAGFGEEYFEKIVLNNQGEVFITGTGKFMIQPFFEISSEMVTIKYSQEAASTSMTMDAPAGSQIIEIAGTNGFSIGDHIVINPGGTTQETNVIAGFGSILLQTPLRYNHNAGERIELLISTSVDEHDDHMPGEFALSQNYPNPFNPSTTILYSLDDRQHVTLTVYDITGREVTRLVNEDQPAGRHSAVFDATRMATGVYFYTLRAGSRSETRKMVYIR